MTKKITTKSSKPLKNLGAETLTPKRISNKIPKSTRPKKPATAPSNERVILER